MNQRALTESSPGSHPVSCQLIYYLSYRFVLFNFSCNVFDFKDIWWQNFQDNNGPRNFLIKTLKVSRQNYLKKIGKQRHIYVFFFIWAHGIFLWFSKLLWMSKLLKNVILSFVIQLFVSTQRKCTGFNYYN